MRSTALSEGFSSFDEEVEQIGIAGEYKFDAWDRSFLTGSLRHDFNEGFEDATTYRLSAAYLVQETGTKFGHRTAPVSRIRHCSSCLGPRGLHPEPKSRPESAKGWDVGVDQALLDGRLNFVATYFDQRITDLIQTQGNTVVNLPGKSKIHGVELGVSVRH